jgi:hypothetical protein
LAYAARINSKATQMTKILIIAAALLSVGAASAETSPSAQAAKPPMVRNIGIAEQGDTIIVRERKAEPVPATKPDQK